MQRDLLEAVLDHVSGGQPALLTGGQRVMLAEAVALAHAHYAPLVAAYKQVTEEPSDD